MADVVKLSARLIRMDGGTQPRATIDGDTVDSYAEALAMGATFPPVTVFFDGSAYWLADGFHRVRAYTQRTITDIPCDVRQGTQRDAILFSLGANATHGKPRTNADKRRAVMVLLADDAWQKEPTRWIAERCSVHHSFVARVKEEMNCRPTTVEGRDGKTRNVENIGKSKPKSDPAPQPKPAPPAEVDEDEAELEEARRKYGPDDAPAPTPRATAPTVPDVPRAPVPAPPPAPSAASPAPVVIAMRRWAATLGLDGAVGFVADVERFGADECRAALDAIARKWR